ncbi:hypothetical protein PTSG_04137 [Salpingoeca rosetta]|uniref:Protein-S-isoprenylcysteine O-methyltransferase n=1 Tax=Salpingoeca rosetta (strain ATCC 50818 / BSB-021) TaxID=946362 RepID=F2U6P6_SALR5|nr:uncharacterized protein PTSG_04137 [Salpingoeca rosetta]EGD83528.1 hypothetical protein PTSG_04137 [Salpingoeca rosetta]|eukprot:XP_004995032.1 hypothetical protein PTSG_04137 [Salpingoeca rosetta]
MSGRDKDNAADSGKGKGARVGGVVWDPLPAGLATAFFSVAPLASFALPTFGWTVPGAIAAAAAVPLVALSSHSYVVASCVSTILGCVCSVGLNLATADYSFQERNFADAGAFLVSLSVFHCSEYIMTALYNQHVLSFDSFLLNHSREYHAALAAAAVEYSLRSYFVPWLHFRPLFYTGLAMAVVGDVARKLAMMTAASNFKHIIATERDETHKLVTHGIYGWCRHPSYFGWSLWAVGTQVLLSNILCTGAYAYAAISFFRDRIEFEEAYLLRFFGNDYARYRATTWSGVPTVP